MSFITQDDIINLGTRLVKSLWKNILNVELRDKFPFNLRRNMEKYGSDKPDTDLICA